MCCNTVESTTTNGSPLNDQQKGAIHAAVESLIKQKVGTAPDRQQEGAGSPYAPVQPPATKPPLGSAQAPGEHIFNLPPIKWDIPTRAAPKPNLPQAPLASDANAVDAIIQSLDDNSLIPDRSEKHGCGRKLCQRQRTRAQPGQHAGGRRTRRSSTRWN